MLSLRKYAERKTDREREMQKPNWKALDIERRRIAGISKRIPE
jgi:hypothetical protein